MKQSIVYCIDINACKIDKVYRSNWIIKKYPELYHKTFRRAKEFMFKHYCLLIDDRAKDIRVYQNNMIKIHTIKKAINQITPKERKLYK